MDEKGGSASRRLVLDRYVAHDLRERLKVSTKAGRVADSVLTVDVTTGVHETVRVVVLEAAARTEGRVVGRGRVQAAEGGVRVGRYSR